MQELHKEPLQWNRANKNQQVQLPDRKRRRIKEH
jgi:hypothetical protein